MSVKFSKGMIITAAVVIIAVLLLIFLQPEPDAGKYAVTAPNGLSFGAIKGYENWQLVSSHYRTDQNEIRFLLGNNKMIAAYKDGSGKAGKPFPDGAIIVQIGYSVKENPAFKNATEPDVLKRVEYMMKDGERFKDTGGWGYASFVYDADSSAFKPFGKDKTFEDACFSCHVRVEEKDYIFTDYAQR